MIVHELKCIYIHIPKTAGVSLIHAIMSEILGYETTGQIGHLSNDLKYQFGLRGSQKHKQARNFVPVDISKELWDSYYKFAIVRNPWDRIVSEFHWRHSLPIRQPSLDFKEFIEYCEERMKDTTNKANDIYWTHAQTQKSYVADSNNNILLNDIFRFETLSETVNNIGVRLGVSLNLQKHNASNHKNYRDYYNSQTKEMVRKIYQEDIEMFDYEF